MIAALSLETIRKEATRFGKWMLCRAGNFGERQPAISPSDNVACTGDFQLGFVVAVANVLNFVDIE